MRFWEPLALALLTQAGAPKVPNVTVSAAAAEDTPRTDAPIVEVTVYSDRARVRRRGHVTLPSAVGVVRLPDLPGAAFLDTVRVSATGGRVLRVEATPVERERLAIAQAGKLLDDLDATDDRLAALDDRATADQWEVSFLAGLAPAPPVPEERREGRRGLAVDVASWGRALDFLGQRAAAARAHLVSLADERRALVAERDRLRAEIAGIDLGGFSRRAVAVVAVVEARAAAPVEVQLEYFVPGARWKPVYDLHYASARGQARLETAAVVEQATGEDWEQAALSFSTAMPGRGIDMPELLTWTLGERSEFIPRLRPREPMRPEPLLPFPPVPETERTRARAVEDAVVRARLARAKRPVADPARHPLADKEEAAESARIERLVAEDMAVAGLDGEPTRVSREASAMEAAPVSARPQQRSSPLLDAPAIRARTQSLEREVVAESEEDDEDEVSVTTRIKRFLGRLGGPSRPAAEKEKAPETYATVALALRDATLPRPAPKLSDPYLPAVSGGGLDFVYRAPVPATIPSTGKQIRIPLSAQTFRATAFHQATPALAATAFLRARVRNDGTRPLLRGPVAIFGDGELVGVGEIRTTGPSGELELPLGADQDIRLVREIVPSTKTTGLLIKSDETTYDVRIQVGNYKKQAATIEITDQVPRSRADKIEVEVLGMNPAPRAGIDLDGTVRFLLDIPAGGTRTITLRYKIVRPRDWMLYQR